VKKGISTLSDSKTEGQRGKAVCLANPKKGGIKGGRGDATELRTRGGVEGEKNQALNRESEKKPAAYPRKIKE